jgi:murein DD-endopeptidase MepM/ murein hydrolase activator NlpD
MSQERWTLLFLKGKNGPVRQYSIAPRTAHLALGGLVAVLTSVSGLGIAVGMGGAARLQARRLQEENQELTSTLEQLRGRVEGLEGTLEGLAQKDGELRIIAGLDEIEDDVLEVGVGGPGLSRPESHPLYPLDPELGETAFAVTYDVGALERRARLLMESLSAASDSLELHAELMAATPSILPTPGLLISRFSASRYHPISDRALPHEGVDLSAPRGSPILASAGGVVVEAGNFAGYGLMVEIDHGFGFTTRYGHASKLLVRAGQRVVRGDLIAQVGSTGIATGPHLHYEVRLNGRPQNPMNYVLPDAMP